MSIFPGVGDVTSPRFVFADSHEAREAASAAILTGLVGNFTGWEPPDSRLSIYVSPAAFAAAERVLGPCGSFLTATEPIDSGFAGEPWDHRGFAGEPWDHRGFAGEPWDHRGFAGCLDFTIPSQDHFTIPPEAQTIMDLVVAENLPGLAWAPDWLGDPDPRLAASTIDRLVSQMGAWSETQPAAPGMPAISLPPRREPAGWRASESGIIYDDEAVWGGFPVRWIGDEPYRVCGRRPWMPWDLDRPIFEVYEVPSEFAQRAVPELLDPAEALARREGRFRTGKNPDDGKRRCD